MQWHNGSQWSTFSRSNTWFINATAVKPDGTEGGSNSTGQGTAENIPNARPTANAGPDQCKVKNTTVTLDGSKSSDSDIDVIWAYAWTQRPGGTPVTLDDPTSESPSFTVPSAPTSLTFDLKVKDVTMGFCYHRPTNYESFADSVIVQIVNKQSDC